MWPAQLNAPTRHLPGYQNLPESDSGSFQYTRSRKYQAPTRHALLGHGIRTFEVARKHARYMLWSHVIVGIFQLVVYFFSERVINWWNSRENSVVCAPSVNSCKYNLQWMWSKGEFVFGILMTQVCYTKLGTTQLNSTSIYGRRW